MSLTRYIEQDLKHRIHNGLDLPCRLTLQGLSAHYRVSPTPVRQAVGRLIDDGYLKKTGKGGRLTVGQGRTTAATPPPAEPPPRPASQYQHVADDLVGLSFLGRETFLREQHAAARYGISRTAMRQIFERLAGLGILEHVPRRGWRLRPFRFEYLVMFTEVRQVMEREALRLARTRLVEQDLRTIIDRNVPAASETDTPQTDNSLHEYLIVKSGNLFIKDFFDRYRRYYDVLHRWEERDGQALAQSVRQHRRIAKALIRRDWPKAQDALIEHIRHSQAGIDRLFEGDRPNAQLFGSEFRQFIIEQLEAR
ncbi:MAG: GntR family transcriptional regulator [Phycisphaerae bacterium]|nr:GntR family transcriptional regulator [Phycisphaerae bacterium]